MARILLVEDDPIFSSMVSQWLTRELFTVDLAEDGDFATELLALSDYDLLILDWELPGRSGIDILSGYRAKGGTAPVLILTGRGSILDKQVGFNAGSDDYLTKPFNPQELGLRVKALLRRVQPNRSDVLQFENIQLNPHTFEVVIGEEKVELQKTEFRALELFLRNAGTIFSVDALLNRVWGVDSGATVNSVRICITRVRAKLTQARASANIETVHGAGYVFRKLA